jgi:Cft2 family RNA processing exonuclease
MSKKRERNSKDVKITLVGHMGSTVTGSCYKIEFLDKTYYVDMGIYQEKDMKQNYYANTELANLIRKEAVEAVICTHSHL